MFPAGLMIDSVAAPASLPQHASASRAWHVLHVRSRQEKALAEDLSAMEVEHFLPLVRRVRYHAARRAVVLEPLFPGYLFLRGDMDEAYRADRTGRVAHILPVGDQEQLDWELNNIRLALSRHAELDAYPYLSRGVRVEVRAGPLRGLQGIVEERCPSDRLILQVKMLGAARSLEIDGALLERI